MQHLFMLIVTARSRSNSTATRWFRDYVLSRCCCCWYCGSGFYCRL